MDGLGIAMNVASVSAMMTVAFEVTTKRANLDQASSVRYRSNTT